MALLNIFKTFSLMAVLTGIFLGIGYVLGGIGGAFISLLMAFLMNFVSYWFSDKIVLKMYGAKEIKEEDNKSLHEMVEELCKEAKIPKPKLYMLRSNVPNAFATGRNPEHSAVAVTFGLIKNLNQKEIKGVIAHEISHIVNRDTLVQTMAATIGGAITWLSYAFLFDRDRNSLGLLMMIFAPLAAGMVRMSISRSREYMADESGAKLSSDPLGLASALEKIHKISVKNPVKINPSTSHLFIINPLSARGMARLFSTHPPVEDRIKRLKEMKI